MKAILNLFLRISARCREKRFRCFRKRMHLSGTEAMLDVGGGGDWNWDAVSFTTPITVINLQIGLDIPGRISWVQGDACDMSMFKDRAFDLAFSNSVIEHVGDFERQQQMANEIRRVAACYWVQTPYRHFPLEVHMMFPFFQYLPLKLRAWLGVRWPFSFEMMRHGDPLRDATKVWLLNIRQMKRLFPEADIIIERFLGFPKSLVAVYRGKRGQPMNLRIQD
ncbi:MAG: class I SAM-dependent methyltransferase [Kiritimatiellales bacterium]